MADVEEQVRRHVEAQLQRVEPVTAAEARARAHDRDRRGAKRWLGPTPWLSAAAVVLVIAGIATAVTMRNGGDEPAVGSVVQAGSDPVLTLDGHRDFQLAVLNGTTELTDAELQARYTDSFRAAVSPDKLRSVEQTLVDHGHWRVLREVERRDETVLAVQLAAADGTQLRLTMHRTDDGKLDASTILMAQPCAAPVPTSARLDPDLRSQLDWVVALLGSQDDPTDADLEAHLAPSFLAVFPAADFRTGLAQLRGLGPYSLRAYEGPPQTHTVIVRVGLRTGEEARLNLSVEPGQPHRILQFSILTQPPCRLPG